jgi:DNA polymerase III delta prime subunit
LYIKGTAPFGGKSVCIADENFNPIYFDGQSFLYTAAPTYATFKDVMFTNTDENAILYYDRAETVMSMLKYVALANKEKNEKPSHGVIYETTSDGDLVNVGKISPKKRFDHLFFEQKEATVSILNRFKEGTLYPESICMDNKLGILLYGPPGTGKTGTISAIANLMGRSLLVINFAKLTSVRGFKRAIEGVKRDEVILVFEEFDYLLSLMDAPESIADETKTNEWKDAFMIADPEERKRLIEVMREQKTKPVEKMNMQFLLTYLDGIEDASGRLIVATTNNPERIPRAILRPGRFDLKLCLDKCSPQMYSDIVHAYYGVRVDPEGMPDKKHSPLELINTCLATPNLGDLLKMLPQQAEPTNAA